jgi:hypothetical protein
MLEAVRVAHGTWIAGIAFHASRQSLKIGEYFQSPTELHDLADELVDLRHLIQASLGKYLEPGAT